MTVRNHIEVVEMFAVGSIQPSSGGVAVNEGLRPKRIKDYFLMRWIIIYGAMLLIALLLGSVPVFVSYRKMMDK